MKKKDRSRSELLLQIIELITTLNILAAAVLQYQKIWTNGLMLAIPLLGILQLLNGFLCWKKDRDLAAFHLIVAGFIGLVCIGVFCI